jgi:alanyl-tRNA synthetase
MTHRLYQQDPYLTEFTAQIIRMLPLDSERWGIVLDRTAFYPEGGGQPADTGWLDAIPVLDTADTEEGLIHITPAKPAGNTVQARIDWVRRFDHMQQHSGEHLLSAAFAAALGAENIGFHLGAEACYIDINQDVLNYDQVCTVETLANSYVFANRPVSAHFLSGDELGGFKLRKQPGKIFATIRLVDMDGLDCCPCGGTHVAATGEVGIIKIRNWERKAGGVRVDFVCGGRALQDYQLTSQVVKHLSARLSAAPQEVPAALDRQLDKSEALHKELGSVRQELNAYLAADLLLKADIITDLRVVIKQLPGATPDLLADLAKKIVASGKAVALLGSADSVQNKTHLLFAASPGGPDVGGLLKTILPLLGGKGGGSAIFAQGGGAYTATLEDILRQAAAKIS